MCLIFNIKHCQSKNFLPNLSSFFLNFPLHVLVIKANIMFILNHFFPFSLYQKKKGKKVYKLQKHLGMCFQYQMGRKRHSKHADLMQLTVYFGLSSQNERRSFWICRYFQMRCKNCLVEQITTKGDVFRGY